MTIFQKIIKKEVPAEIVYEDDVCLAFHDINPQAPTHILIIPKKEIKNLDSAQLEDQSILGHLFLKSAEIARDQNIADEGYRTVINTKDFGGQTVDHIHIHLLGGRPLTWPPG